jgi:CDGSH-type Zn-finger protein
MKEPDLTIRCRKDGPLIVKGPVRLIDSEGNEIEASGEKANIALCRCGASGNQPFCDGSHREAGFGSTES